ncbi:MAG: glycoside hydrolase family 3 C-terminal domain-containing protein [Bacteroidetes bacterium]|nr:glycoside hydrolase family 3 C-terminal domain-containing protein [Bacteroidota bacterium]
MTMDEKLAQLECPWTTKAKCYANNHFDDAEAIKLFPNGLGMLFRLSDGANSMSTENTPEPSQIALLANSTQRFFINKTRLGIPVFYVEEGLHGLMVRNGTNFPSALGMSSSWNESLTKDVFSAIAAEGRAVGSHALLAPVIDLALDPRWGRTEETMGEDPYLTSRLGVVKVKALQGDAAIPDSNHVVAVLKHFGAHGQSEGGINTGPSFVSERQLREVNFKPFKAAIEEGGALGLMPNYNEISGIPAHANRWLLTDVLRKEWGFKGVVISDYTATDELKERHHIAADYPEAGAKALNAGVDVELTEKFTYSGIPADIKNGTTSLATLNKAVLHVLELKFRLGLFERPYINTNKTAIVGSAEHAGLALKAARQSIVLLKNENNLLPLDRKKYKKIAIIGPNADQCILGGYSQTPKSKISPLEAIREKYKDVEVVYAPGCLLNASHSNSMFAPVKPVPHEENIKLIREAVQAARTSDVVVLMLGGNDRISREAVSNFSPGDLANLELFGDQNELIDSLKSLNKPMAAFVFSGPPVSFMHLSQSVPAVVQCWYLGQETGYAVAETLFGDNNPSGKLTISIPRSAGHLPDYYFVKPTARERGYNLDSSAPLYPFGFGLSYTKFEYNNLKISKKSITAKENVTVTIDVKNTGARPGDEIVQLYIHDLVSSVTRPVKELKDFKRISLAPGETKQVSFTITPDKLQFYDVNMKEIIEPGDFDIMVGPSSQQYTTAKLTVIK